MAAYRLSTIRDVVDVVDVVDVADVADVVDVVQSRSIETALDSSR